MDDPTLLMNEREDQIVVRFSSSSSLPKNGDDNVSKDVNGSISFTVAIPNTNSNQNINSTTTTTTNSTSRLTSSSNNSSETTVNSEEKNQSPR